MEASPFEGWAVYDRAGNLIPYSIQREKIDSMKCYAYDWEKCRKYGYHCLPVTVTPRDVKP